MAAQRFARVERDPFTCPDVFTSRSSFERNTVLYSAHAGAVVLNLVVQARALIATLLLIDTTPYIVLLIPVTYTDA